MRIPNAETTAPTPVLDTLTGTSASASTLSVYGKASGLDHLLGSPHLQYLWMSGVNAKSAAILAHLPALRRLVVVLWRLNDLAAIAALTQLEHLAIVGSSLRSLAGLEHLRNLRSLILFGNCNFGDIGALQRLDRLDTLCLEGGFSKQLVLTSLAPLAHLENLQRLRLASVRVQDGSLRPLHGLHALRDVFIAKTFSAAEFRALARALPDVRGEFVDSFREGKPA